MYVYYYRHNTHQRFCSLHTHEDDSKRKFLFCEIRRRRWIYNVFFFYTLLLFIFFFYAFITLNEHLVFLGSIVNSRLYWISWCLLYTHTLMRTHTHIYKWIMYYARTAVLTGHLSYEFIHLIFSAGSSAQQRIPMEIISFSYLSDRCRT